MEVELSKEYRKAMRAAVRRGVAVLDQIYGAKKWPRKIKLRKFNMSSTCNCVVGQLCGIRSGDFFASDIPAKTRELTKAMHTQSHVVYDSEHGFDYTFTYANGAAVDWDESSDAPLYEELKALWVKVIRRRRGYTRG